MKYKMGIVQIALISSSLIFVGCSLTLSEDNRKNIYSELLVNNDNYFDYELFEDVLNRKFLKAESRKYFYVFVKKVGGSCSNENRCVVPISSTICVSNKAIITIEDNHFKVKSFTDGC